MLNELRRVAPPRLPLRRELARPKDLEARLREREREAAAYTKV